VSVAEGGIGWIELGELVPVEGGRGPVRCAFAGFGLLPVPGEDLLAGDAEFRGVFQAEFLPGFP
jgi:hypothetical protein